MSGSGGFERFNEEECLALAEQSPAAVAAGDKSAWMALFARYNLVEDPVGSSPHITGIYDSRAGYRGRGRLSRFYDTFIAPNTICFHVDRDSVCGLHVMRDLTIEIIMSPKVVVRVPMHLLYELTVEQGELKIFRLAAHWELWPMLKQQMASGLPFLQVGCASAVRMWRHMGIAGVAGFMRALSGVGAKGKAQVAQFARCFKAGDQTSLEGLFASPDIEIAFPHEGTRLSIAALAGQGGEVNFTRILAAGNVVSATVDYHGVESHYQGVAIFELDRRSLRIIALTFYWSRPQGAGAADG
jgi:hypothetical protein